MIAFSYGTHSLSYPSNPDSHSIFKSGPGNKLVALPSRTSPTRALGLTSDFRTLSSPLVTTNNSVLPEFTTTTSTATIEGYRAFELYKESISSGISPSNFDDPTCLALCDSPETPKQSTRFRLDIVKCDHTFISPPS